MRCAGLGVYHGQGNDKLYKRAVITDPDRRVAAHAESPRVLRDGQACQLFTVQQFSAHMTELARGRDSGAVEIVKFKDRVSSVSPQRTGSMRRTFRRCTSQSVHNYTLSCAGF
jgi:hypothetical protein